MNHLFDMSCHFHPIFYSHTINYMNTIQIQIQLQLHATHTNTLHTILTRRNCIKWTKFAIVYLFDVVAPIEINRIKTLLNVAHFLAQHNTTFYFETFNSTLDVILTQLLLFRCTFYPLYLFQQRNIQRNATAQYYCVALLLFLCFVYIK